VSSSPSIASRKLSPYVGESRLELRDFAGIGRCPRGARCKLGRAVGAEPLVGWDQVGDVGVKLVGAREMRQVGISHLVVPPAQQIRMSPLVP
jgi:hypothetical protein